jgi:hypothetical protein
MDYISGDPLEIGNGPHLFLDDTLVEDRWALSRRIHQPYPYMGNPILVADRPWEERPYRPQVIYDDETAMYRMYYQCFSGSNYWMSKGPSYFTCMAESKDCLNWTKPEWPDSPFGEHPATNILSVDVDPKHRTARRPGQIQAPWVFTDPNETDGARRYKMIYNHAGLRLAHSADGIHWTSSSPEPLFYYHSDTMNHVLWNEEIGKWMLYMRPPMFAGGVHEGPGKRHYRRRTAIALSDDLLNWSTPRTVIYPDELDIPDYDATHVWKLRDQYIGFITLLHADEDGTNDVMLAVSRDGFRWEKPIPRQTWLPRGPVGTFDAGCASIGGDPIQINGENWFYTSGFPQPQKVFEQDSGIGLYKVLEDRFCALEAPEPVGKQSDFGYLLTKEFIWRGKGLSVNCQMHGGDEHTFGSLHVEVVRRPIDAQDSARMGDVVEGHSLDDCDLIRANAPNMPVKWNGESDLSFLNGQPVYLRFRLRNGGLFSFTMED